SRLGGIDPDIQSHAPVGSGGGGRNEHKAMLAADDRLDRERPVARALDAHGRDGALIAARGPVLEALGGGSPPETRTRGARSLRQRELLRARGRAVDEDLKDCSTGAAPEGRVADQRVAAALLVRQADDLALRKIARLRILHRERLAQKGLLQDARSLHG